MEVNKHINFLKRRGFLIKESSQMELSFDEPVGDGLNFKSLCSEGSEVFCKLLNLADKEGIKNDMYLSKKLVKAITKIYTYLKPPIYNNRSKFNRLVSVILDQNIENSINTFEIIADVIDDVNIGKLRKSIDKLTNDQIELGDEALLQIINNIKHQSYTKYENSFIGDHFESYRTRLELSYRGEEILNLKFSELLLDYLNNGKDYHELSNMMYKAVINNFKNGIGKFIKADLKCISSLMDENGNTIINNGDYVEVKKLDYKGDSYLSEFFSIYKTPKELPKKLKTPDGIKLYNNVIDSLFLKLNNNDQGLIKLINDNFAGIIYDENRFIPKTDIILYWSNKGQRVDDHRLSIRYRLKSNTFHSFIYNNETDVLKSEEIETSIIGNNIMLPLTVNENINEASVTDKKGGEWDRESSQGKMIRTKGGTKELYDDFDWAIQQAEATPDDPKVEALIRHFGSASEVIGEDFNDDAGHWYGHHTIFELQNGEEWVVGTETSMGNALHEYMSGYVEDVGLENLGIDLSDYVDVSDYWISNFCDDEAENYFDDMSDDDLLEVYGDYDITAEISDLEEKEDDLKEELEDNSNKLRYYIERFENMETQNQDYISYGYERPQYSEEDFENLQNQIDELESIVSKLKNELEEIPYRREEYVDELRRQSKEDHVDDCERCMQDPVDCIVNEKGWYRTGAEAIDAFGWDVDTDSIVEYLSQDGYDAMAGYDGDAHEEYVDGETYILIRVN